MSVRVPNSFELIVRSILHIAIFAGPFEVKLNRYSWMQPVSKPAPEPAAVQL